jgi:hypothetical protein
MIPAEWSEVEAVPDRMYRRLPSPRPLSCLAVFEWRDKDTEWEDLASFRSL